HPTETTRLADVLLPAAQWGEKEWTSTNSERTISYSPKLFDPPGLALPDWQIVARFAERMGFQGFGYSSAAAVWDEFVGLTPARSRVPVCAYHWQALRPLAHSNSHWQGGKAAASRAGSFCRGKPCRCGTLGAARRHARADLQSSGHGPGAGPVTERGGARDGVY